MVFPTATRGHKPEGQRVVKKLVSDFLRPKQPADCTD